LQAESLFIRRQSAAKLQNWLAEDESELPKNTKNNYL